MSITAYVPLQPLTKGAAVLSQSVHMPLRCGPLSEKALPTIIYWPSVRAPLQAKMLH